MQLESLIRYDRPTANNILAAAALATSASPGLEDDQKFIGSYKEEVEAVISEIRGKLNLRSDDLSAKAKLRINEYFSNAFDSAIFQDESRNDALNRAGDLGRLSPNAYDVELTANFKRVFLSLATNKKNVQSTILSPDEYQHLLNENTLVDDRDNLSLFIKFMPGHGSNEPHWFLVQTVRRGLKQIAQSAWRIFSSDVDLRGVSSPVEALQAFTSAFGVPIKVGDTESTFVDAKNVLHGSGAVPIHIDNRGRDEVFFSFSQRAKTTIPNIGQVGIAYCIDIKKYRIALKAHGFNV